MFKRAGGMGALRRRSEHLTGSFAEELSQSPHFIKTSEVEALYGPGAGFDGQDAKSDEGGSTFDETPRFTIITPSEPSERGAQLSLLFLPPGKGIMQRVFAGLKSYGVIGDERNPDVIRLAPAPLYNTEKDCSRALQALKNVFDELSEAT